MRKKYIFIIFVFLPLMFFCYQTLYAQKSAPTTMDLLQNKYWVFKEALRISNLMYEQYDQRECCTNIISKYPAYHRCQNYYLSDTIIHSFQQDSVGMVKNGKYIVRRRDQETDVYKIIKLTPDSLILDFCRDHLYIGGGPVVYTAESKRFIKKMKRKVRMRE